MAFLDTSPKSFDSDNVLLFKICQIYSQQAGGAHAPEFGDTDNNLLFKICQILSGL
jgi:hypothetical protein